MTSIDNIDQLILKVLLNEASEIEILEFSNWIQNRENKHYFESVKLLWVASAQKVTKDIPCNEASKRQYLIFIQREKSRRRKLISLVASIAAAIIVVSFIVLEGFTDSSLKNIDTNKVISDHRSDKIIRKINHEQIVLVTSDGEEHIIGSITDTLSNREFGVVNKQQLSNLTSSIAVDSQDYIKYNTLYVPRGKRLCVELSDKTIMWINSDTKVKYPATFPNNKRELWVEGNAYFEVAKDSHRPFIVNTGIVSTIALGTIFEVENYDSFKCKITLLGGAVRVDNNLNDIVLSPNEQIQLEAGKDELVRISIDAQKYGRWKDNVLIFDNESLSSLLSKLSRWHNIDIVNNAHDLDDVRFNGTLSDGSINEHLRIISNNIKIKYIIKGKNVYIGQ